MELISTIDRKKPSEFISSLVEKEGQITSKSVASAVKSPRDHPKPVEKKPMQTLEAGKNQLQQILKITQALLKEMEHLGPTFQK